ncbi:hypothetical protein N9189_00090 [Pirellulaceae bacterium]|jgi:hypothetical protein|nr:hypothetical protein [Pirellulaceae bacterium]
MSQFISAVDAEYDKNIISHRKLGNSSDRDAASGSFPNQQFV